MKCSAFTTRSAARSGTTVRTSSTPPADVPLTPTVALPPDVSLPTDVAFLPSAELPIRVALPTNASHLTNRPHPTNLAPHLRRGRRLSSNPHLGRGAWASRGTSRPAEKRERDNQAWGDAMSGAGSWSLTGRQYLLQNWRADVVLATDSGGSITDRIRYSAYGEPQRYSLCDLVCGGSAGTAPDSVIDANDYTAFINAFGANDPLADVNADGVVDGSDYSIFINAFFAGSDGPAGTGTLSNELDAGFRRGYAGYEFDPVLGASTASIYHVRNRVYDAENGRWNKRDPLGYVDGLGIYNYVKNAPIDKIDYSGLCQKPDYPNLCKGRAGVDFFLILLEGKNLKYQIPGKAPLPNAIPPKIGCGSIIEIPEMIPGAPCLYFEHELFHAVHQIQTCELYGENEFRRLYNDKL